MASIDECEQALHTLAERLRGADSATRHTASVDRTVSCTLRDLDVVFAARLSDGQLGDIRKADTAEAQIRITLSSDDLLALVAGTLNMASAWATGRVRIDASMRDLLRLRNIF
jgi:predicted lipid carrier protein YhbT